jgi:hypothetical protein
MIEAAATPTITTQRNTASSEIFIYLQFVSRTGAQTKSHPTTDALRRRKSSLGRTQGVRQGERTSGA